MKSMLNRKMIQTIIMAVTAMVLCTAFYLQYMDELIPCPLCMMQRVMMIALLLASTAAILMKKRCAQIGLMSLMSFFVLAGIIFAARQLYLESLPVPDTGMCLPGIEAVINKLPWDELIHAFVWGSKTSCGEISWTFLNFSMAAWSLLYFIFMALLLALCWIKPIGDERV